VVQSNEKVVISVNTDHLAVPAAASGHFARKVTVMFGDSK
jgi:hypothetical protein